MSQLRRDNAQNGYLTKPAGTKRGHRTGTPSICQGPDRNAGRHWSSTPAEE